MNFPKLALISMCTLLGGLSLVSFFMPNKEESKACYRLQAKLDLSDRFCQGLATRAAQERCNSLSDNPEVLGQCMRIIVPAAHSSCMDYLNIQGMKNEVKELCQ